MKNPYEKYTKAWRLYLLSNIVDYFGNIIENIGYGILRYGILLMYDAERARKESAESEE